MNNFGDRLKLARKNLDMTQADLAKKSNLTTAAICGYEKNSRNPNMEALIKIQKALLGLSLDYLVVGEYQNNCAKCSLIKYRVTEILKEI